MTEEKTKAFLGVILIMIFLVILLALNYLLVWLDKANCDAMNGSYSTTFDGMVQTSTCIVTEQIALELYERICKENGELD